MSPEAFRDHLDRLGYDQALPGRSYAAFSRAIKTDERTVRRWVAGTVPVPYAVEMLLTGKKIPRAPDRPAV